MNIMYIDTIIITGNFINIDLLCFDTHSFSQIYTLSIKSKWKRCIILEPPATDDVILTGQQVPLWPPVFVLQTLSAITNKSFN